MGSRAIEISATERAITQVILKASGSRGWSGRRLGEEAGITKARIALLLRNERPTTLSDFEAMCRALGLSPSAVVREAETAVAAREREETTEAQRAAEADRIEALLRGGARPEHLGLAAHRPGYSLDEEAGYDPNLGEESQAGSEKE